MHGAIRESQHIFIAAGLNFIKKKKISVLEVGFGTGLNALLTLINSENDSSEILFEAVELHPLDSVCVSSLNYLSVLNVEHLRDKFLQMHSAEWNAPTKISENFHLKKTRGDIREVALPSKYDLIYFDAFDPVAQPLLWTEEVFSKIFQCTNPGGILVTYSSKGSVRRAMESAGYSVEKLAGPHGKREIVRAVSPAL